MKRLTPDSPELKSADLVAENIERLRELFPEAFANEEKIDFDVLRQLLGDRVDDGEERYGLNWHGKRAARQLALTPSTGTLRPCPEESVDWDTSQNIFIEGDNLEVLKLLQKSYAGKVKLIYIDPPYNTGNDFIYPDDFGDNIQNYLAITGQTDGKQKIASNAESDGRYHSNWLSMMTPRLKLAQTLLQPDGVMFISIDDVELVGLRSLCDDIFGADNFIATLIWQKVFSPKNTARYFSVDQDYIVCYAKSKEIWEPQLLPRSEEATARYDNPDNDPRGPWASSDLTARNYYGDGQYEVTGPTGKTFTPARGTYWRVSKEKFARLDADGRIWWGSDGGNMPRTKRFLAEVKDGVTPQTLLLHTAVGNTQEAKKELLAAVDFAETENVLNSVKPTRLLKHLLGIGTSKSGGDIVLDFFAGSGTTGDALMAMNAADGGDRRFIGVQLQEPLPKTEPRFKTLSDITKARLQSAGRRHGKTAKAGFRVYKLDTGNVRPWEASRDTLAEALTAAVDHVKSDRTEDDLLYDMILKHGLDLCSAIDEKQIGGHKVRAVGGGVVFTCFGSRITAADVEPLADGIAKWRDDLAPANPELSRVVFRDSAFETDVAKTNLAAILKQKRFDEKLVVSL
ncbi:MAG: site-specific DNA-methyltransferase [Planctomycetes bacterium]|nr:site-specific DNA-methyltransferase [Planctomycetota bacterium]